jgi:hypothetical protein
MDQSHQEFPHASHLDAVRWPQLQERGALVPGWVQRGRVVKSVGRGVTYCTYHLPLTVPQIDAPLPDGFSWSNLDLCGGWSRDWSAVDGQKTLEDNVILHRVLVGKKVCGSFLSSVDGSAAWLPLLSDVRDIMSVHPDHSLVERPHHYGPDRVMCWVAPKKTLDEAVELEPIADWLVAIGFAHARQMLAKRADLWLPDRADDYDDLGAPITGLILGYPPASSVG